MKGVDYYGPRRGGPVSHITIFFSAVSNITNLKKTVSKFPILVISNIKISFYQYQKFTTLIPNPHLPGDMGLYMGFSVGKMGV